MIFVIWLMLVALLGMFAWFSNVKNSNLPVLALCIITFPLLFGIQHIMSTTRPCNLGNETYRVLGAKVTLNMEGEPDLIYLLLDDNPPRSCYIKFTKGADDKMQEQRRRTGDGAMLVISGGDLDIDFPKETIIKPEAQNGL